MIIYSISFSGKKKGMHSMALMIKVKIIVCLCCGLNVFLPKSYLETLTPKVMIVEGEVFGR